jgi:hypothetical protein
MICLEKCEDTLDSLLEKKLLTNDSGLSALFQIVMILITLQKTFDFTHNDLHVNNVMYVTTDIEYLYYKYENMYYKVPTYGRIYKIIDFGRAIYRFSNKQFCSDSFARNGDGWTQYNCAPFFDKYKEEIAPNYSFDLTRLACSVVEIIAEDHYLSNSAFITVLNDWLCDDNGVSVLYRENKIRYHGFKLYKMIAKTVHKHVPSSQLSRSCFQQYICTDKLPHKTDKIMNINKIPSYV